MARQHMSLLVHDIRYIQDLRGAQWHSGKGSAELKRVSLILG